MCGISGIINFSEKVEYKYLEKMNNNLFHRGPDRGDIWIAENQLLGFAHRRLSIIDLSDAGNQPMLDEDNGNIIVLNGEIYNFGKLKEKLIEENYLFQSSSDTEVLLKAYDFWGNKCLEFLEGMFSFAIYNLEKNKILFARDRAGEKPFFYYISDKKFIFSSELKSIINTFTDLSILNKKSADCYFGMGFVPGELCIINKVKKLQAGRAMELNCKTMQLNEWKYWNPPFYVKSINQDNNLKNKTKELEKLLSNSVKKQLVSDVPIGVLLSGGIDSSIITSLASKYKKNIKTFTVTFPGEQKYDESEYARLIANAFNTDHIELEANSINPRDLLPQLAKQYDEPIIDSSMIPTFLITKLVRNHCTVVLGGDGGDELFGGYNHYSRLIWSKEMTKHIPSPVKNLLSKAADKYLPMGMKGKIWLQSLAYNLENELPLIASYFDKSNRKKLIDKTDWPYVSEIIREKRIFKTNNLLERATRTDFENYLVEDILVKTDRASMLNSLELRAPFLDHNIIEFAFKLDSSLKTNKKERKIILKELCKNLLPSKFELNRKQGFAIPLNQWLKNNSWLNFCKEILLDKDNHLYNHKYIETLFNNQKKGAQLGERIFALTMFRLWMIEYNIQI